MVQGAPIQWQEPGTCQEKLEDTRLFWMMMTTWAQKVYLMILKSWQSYSWEKWNCVVSSPKVYWEIDRFLFYHSLINGRRCAGCYSHYTFPPGIPPALTFLLIQIFWIFKTLVKCHLLQVVPSQNYSLPLWLDSKCTPSVSSDSLHSSLFPQDGQLTQGTEHFWFIFLPHPHYPPQCLAYGICLQNLNRISTYCHGQAVCLFAEPMSGQAGRTLAKP